MGEERRTNSQREMKVTVFLGGGRITSALCAGLRLGGYQDVIVVYDRHPAKLRALRRASTVSVARNLRSAVERAGMLIVAVRPGSLAGILREVVESGAQPALCVSLAAGIPLARLRSAMGPQARWVRAMPSPVCRAARGLTALTFDRTVTRAERARVRNLFARVGQVIEIPERQLDAFTVTYSSSHGYHALATLAGAAQRAGLNRETAFAAAAHALSDGITHWRESGLRLTDLLQEAATPGGIAAATMAAMDRAGFAQAVRKGLAAGMRRARRNAGAT